MPKIDIYKTVTDKIVTAMEANDGSWCKPYRSGIARNAVTGKDYHGMNILLLWASSGINEFTCNDWATYKQWKTKDAQVKANSKGTMITFYKPIQYEDKDTGEARVFHYAKPAWVFNAAQVEGYNEHLNPDCRNSGAISIDALETFVKNTKAIIKNGVNPCYIPSKDEINMPLMKDFYTTEGYYSTIFHELGHWTGTKERCNRDLTGRFGNKAYAMEELIAELCSAFTCAKTGVEKGEPRKDHAQYLQSWISVLKANPKAIFAASKQATLASEYLDNQQGKD